MKLIYKKLIIAVLFVAVLGMAAFLAVELFALNFGREAASRNSFTGTIELTEDGFSPKEAVIYKGQTVTFSTSSGKSFWPASDSHPNHTIYSDFDPKEAIPPDKTWSFTFNQIGEWRYHDHLLPYFSGKITVKDVISDLNLGEDCTKQANDDKCWNEIIGAAFEKDGSGGALEAIGYLYVNDSKFVNRGCHAFAHIVGEKAVLEFEQNPEYKKWNFPNEATYCGYGFLHGLFEHFFRNRPDSVYAQEVCDYLGPKFSKTHPLLYINCYHGMGHGFMQDPPDFETLGQPQKMIDLGLEKCDQITPDHSQNEKSECVEGVFNVMIDRITRSAYGLKPMDPQNPFELCQNQKKQYQWGCYYEFTMKLPGLLGNDIEKLASEYAEKISDPAVAVMVMNSSVAAIMQDSMSKDDYSIYVDSCHKIASFLKDGCLRGITGGLRAHGLPGQEYVKLISFCSSLDLPAEKQSCYEDIFTSFSYLYSTEKIQQVCATVPEETYKARCKKI